MPLNTKNTAPLIGKVEDASANPGEKRAVSTPPPPEPVGCPLCSRPLRHGAADDGEKVAWCDDNGCGAYRRVIGG